MAKTEQMADRVSDGVGPSVQTGSCSHVGGGL